MQTHTGPFSKEARSAAQLAYSKGFDALKAHGYLTEADRRFLLSQRPRGVDGAGRIVLEFATPAEAAAAGSSPALNRIARQLREGQLAAGLERTVARQPPKKKVGLHRSGPPQQKVLYLPAFLASSTLPHSKVEGAEFSRVNGNVRLSMLAPEDPGLPYGVYPRLILMHLTTKALLQRERAFYVGESANEFLSLMGIGDSGGVNGASTRARDQLRRLCVTSFAYHDKSEDRGRNIVLADRWVTWPGRGLHVRLAETFFSVARGSAVPLDAAIIHGLRRSALSLDTYAWLTYRIARLKEETLIPWRSLEKQFGAEYTHPRDFRVRFRRSLGAVKELWNGVDAEPRDRGLYLRPGAPSVLNWLERTAAKGRTSLGASA